MRRASASSFSARLKDCFVKTPCATGAGNLQASNRISGARNTSSGEQNSRSSRADSREDSPGVSASASQEREASSSIAPRAYAQNNALVNYPYLLPYADSNRVEPLSTVIVVSCAAPQTRFRAACPSAKPHRGRAKENSRKSKWKRRKRR